MTNSMSNTSMPAPVIVRRALGSTVAFAGALLPSDSTKARGCYQRAAYMIQDGTACVLSMLHLVPHAAADGRMREQKPSRFPRRTVEYLLGHA